jgi:membrane protease YdiL (CAAX protease family)
MEPEIKKSTKKTRKGHVAAIILFLWLIYTVVYTLHLDDSLSTALEFIPGILGIITLLVAGFSPRECYLYFQAISRRGILLLSAFSLLLIPILLSGQWTGWNWLSGLLYAPASGISQELFFRVSLLTIFTRTFRAKPFLAVFLQAVFFAIWHMPLVFTEAPLTGAIAVSVVTFIGGLAWAYQVQHDKTVYWAMTQHIIYLMAMSLFTWD